MDADKDNANPTILNPSDLPTRHQPTSTFQRADGGTGLFDRLTPSSVFFSDPLDSSVASSDSESDDQVEAIDEQEIFGSSSSFKDFYLMEPQYFAYETIQYH